MAEDNSVVFALKELSRIEDERIAAEAKQHKDAAEAEVRAREDARRRREEEEAHAHRVAEAEARARVERDAELAAREREAAQRVETLRAELAAVQADRERMHARIASAADDSWVARRSERSSSTGWIAAFGAAAVVAIGLVAILVTNEPVIEQRIVEVPVERTVFVEPETAATTETAPAAEAAAPEAEPEPVVRHTRPTRPHRPTQTMMDDPLHGIDCDPDDPVCGI